MIKSILLLAAILLAAATLPGCHYYINATPRIIISSEPFAPPPGEP